MEVEVAVREHARRLLGGESSVREDLVPGAALTPGDLLVQLAAARFESYEIVAHAKIGAHHVFKTKFLGSTVVVVQARWARDGDGRWRVRDAEVVRTEAGPPRATPPPSTL